VNRRSHLLDFDGDLYGARLRLEFAGWLGDQREILSADDLTAENSGATYSEPGRSSMSWNTSTRLETMAERARARAALSYHASSANFYPAIPPPDTRPGSALTTLEATWHPCVSPKSLLRLGPARHSGVALLLGEDQVTGLGSAT